MVYDVSDRSSFEALESWILEMQNEIGNQSEVDNIAVCVCANKVRISKKFLYHTFFLQQEVTFSFDIKWRNAL